MTWVKLDDKFHRNPKILGLSDAAHRIYVDALSFCGDMPEPNGYLSEQSAASFVKSRGKRLAVLDELVGVNCFERIFGGYLIHDFEQYLPKTSRDRTKAWRDRKREEAKRLGDASVTSQARHSDAGPQPYVTSPNSHRASRSRARATGLETTSTPAVTPEPDPEPDSKQRSDMHGVAINGVAPAPTSAAPSPQVQVLRLLDWLMAKHGWSTWSSLDTQKREAQLAIRIVELGIPVADLYRTLDAWWQETDPDDRPSSLGYFWTRLQDEQHAALKQRRSHTRTDEGLTKLVVTKEGST